MMQKYAIRTKTCSSCGVEFTGRFPENRKYCSLECYRHGKRTTRMTGSLHACKQCGKDVYRNKGFNGDAFCNKVCHDAYQSRNKTTHLCKICGTEFKWSPSRSKTENPTYCSIACRNVCSEWKKNAVIAGNLKQQNSKQPTRLEVAGYEILGLMGIEYKRQSLVANKFTVDAEILEKKIIIQWDGDYWHGYRANGDSSPLEARQAKRAALDKSQDAYMRKMGYVVLRFWEHEVFNQPEKVREAIKSAIRQSAA